MNKTQVLRKILVLLVIGAVAAAASVSFIEDLFAAEPIVNGPGVSEVKMLSDWFPGLKGTAGDTRVFVLRGEEEGGSALIFGGTHTNEVSGPVMAVVMIENAVVEKGTLYVIPFANNSGFTATQPGEGYPSRFRVKTDWGERWFRFGARQTNPLHQWPDPDCYTHYPSGQLLSGMDMRNLNRCFPGKPNGLLTEKVAYGITSLIEAENVDVCFDLHEAEPMFPVINTIVAHQRAMEIGVMANLMLSEMEDMQIGLEASAEKLHGFSHRELGDHTDTLAFLAETCNPIQDPMRARTNEQLILDGKCDFLVKGAKLGILYVPFDENGSPLEDRVGRHSSTVQEIIANYNFMYPEREILINDMPRWEEIRENGVGFYLRQSG
jgi:predicted deacylase